MGEWWDDDPELLGATLGLLAAWDSSAVPATADAAVNMADVTDASCSSVGPSSPRMSKRAKRSVNISRERRKHELTFLRKKLDDMQRQLENLQHTREAQLRPHFRDATHAQLATMAPVWENMATRQYQARRKAELLNAKLKTALRAQLRVAQDLVRVIQLAEHQSRELVPPPKLPVRLAMELGQQHMPEEKQLGQLETLCASWESEFAQCASFAGTSGSLQFLESRAVHSADDATVIELFSSSLLPFPVARVEDTIWSMYLKEEEGKDEHGEIFTQNKVAKATDDVIVSVFSTPSTFPRSGLRGTMHGQFLTKRFHPTATQSVLVSHAQAEPQGFDHTLDGVTTFEDTWMRLIDAKELGHMQFNGPLTVMQHVRREHIYVSEEIDVAKARRRMEAVTEIIMKQVYKEIDRAQGMLEHLLMDGIDRVKGEPQ